MTRTGMPSRRRWLSLVASSALALSGASLLSACDQLPAWLKGESASNFHGIDITGATYAQSFALKDFDGQVRQLSDFKGKLVFLFFGFTQCPDVCPTTMAEVAELRRRLGPDGDKIQAVFISLDPARDTPQVLKAYLQGMDPSFIGLTGTAEQIKNTAREFKIFYQKVDSPNGGYTFDHTAGAYLFDPAGRVRLFVRYGMPLDQLESDVRQLLGLAAAASSSTKL